MSISYACKSGHVCNVHICRESEAVTLLMRTWMTSGQGVWLGLGLGLGLA